MKSLSNTELSPWADRGWYLAVEYATLPGKEQFLKRLARLRELGRFKELLEDGGAITYRNLFRNDQLKDAWDLLTALKPWRAKTRLFLNGEEIAWKDASQVVWCGGFLAPENPCRGDFEARRYEVGCEHKITFAPYHWDRREDQRRHILSFAKLQLDGACHWDEEALFRFLNLGVVARACPLAPARDREGWRRAFEGAGARQWAWSVALRISPALRKRLDPRAFQRDHAFVLKKKGPSLVGAMDIELGLHKGAPAAFLAGDGGVFLGRELDINAGVRRYLEGGGRLRAVRKGERYGSGARRNEIEQVFNLVQWFVLAPERSPTSFTDHDAEPIPEATAGYEAWARQALVTLRLPAPEGAPS